MTTSFNAKEGLIVVRARIRGPRGDIDVHLALDTGATLTLINTALLVSIGYDPGATRERVRVTTGSGVEYPARILVQRVEAIGITRAAFPILAHTLPPSASVDGLLGLDFLRSRRLTIDFRKGSISIR